MNNALATLKGEKRVAEEPKRKYTKKLKLDLFRRSYGEHGRDCRGGKACPAEVDSKLKDMKGDLQMHTTASDGKNPLRRWPKRRAKLGHEYIAITDHSKAVTVANGLDEKRAEAHMQEAARGE